MAVKVLFLHTSEGWMRDGGIAVMTLFRGLDSANISPFLISGNHLLAESARAERVEALCPMPNVLSDSSVNLNLLLWASTVRRIRNFVKTRRIAWAILVLFRKKFGT